MNVWNLFPISHGGLMLFKSLATVSGRPTASLSVVTTLRRILSFLQDILAPLTEIEKDIKKLGRIEYTNWSIDFFSLKDKDELNLIHEKLQESDYFKSIVFWYSTIYISKSLLLKSIAPVPWIFFRWGLYSTWCIIPIYLIFELNIYHLTKKTLYKNILLVLHISRFLHETPFESAWNLVSKTMKANLCNVIVIKRGCYTRKRARLYFWDLLFAKLWPSHN